MTLSLNPGDYDSINDFVIALDASISHCANDLAKAMSYGIDDRDLFEEVLGMFLFRLTYEYDHEASSLITGASNRISIPLTVDMTFVISDVLGT